MNSPLSIVNSDVWSTPHTGGHFQTKQLSLSQHGESAWPTAKSAWKIFRSHTKFQITWIPIEMTGFRLRQFANNGRFHNWFNGFNSPFVDKLEPIAISTWRNLSPLRDIPNCIDFYLKLLDFADKCCRTMVNVTTLLRCKFACEHSHPLGICISFRPLEAWTYLRFSSCHLQSRHFAGTRWASVRCRYKSDDHILTEKPIWSNVGVSDIPNKGLDGKPDHRGQQEEWRDQNVEQSQRGKCFSWTEPDLFNIGVCDKGLQKQDTR